MFGTFARRASIFNTTLNIAQPQPQPPTLEDKEVACFFQNNRRQSLYTFPLLDFEEEKQWSDVLTALSPKTLPTENALERGLKGEVGMEDFMNYNLSLNMPQNLQQFQTQANIFLQPPMNPNDEFGVLGKKRKAVDAGIKVELETGDFVDDIQKGSVYKKGKKSRLQALSRKTPEFIVAEINSTTGKGEFKNTELAVMLFYAYKYFEDFDVYSKVRACMGFKRSRASIRRKVEKLVFYETKIKGGLLGDEETRMRSQNVCLRKFWEMSDFLAANGEPNEVLFSRRLQEQAMRNGFFRPMENKTQPF